MGRAVFISGLVRTDVSRFLVPACLALVRRLLTSPLVLPLCRYPGERFSGAQLHTCVDDLPTGPGSVFEASIMPLTSYAGYLPASPWQVDAILDALTPLLARPIAQLRLRWGHEVNYYASDAGPGPGPGPSPTYAPSPAEYKAAFAYLATRARALDPRITLFFCPNTAPLAAITPFLPPPTAIDVVGIDFYPENKQQATPQHLVAALKPLHDLFPNHPFVLGETGLHYPADTTDKVAWLQCCLHPYVRKHLPRLTEVVWFNYVKDLDYRILDVTKPPSHPFNAPLRDLVAKYNSAEKHDTCCITM